MSDVHDLPHAAYGMAAAWRLAKHQRMTAWRRTLKNRRDTAIPQGP
ncbi:hypothetical protein [Streptomyces wuyuanensis]